MRTDPELFHRRAAEFGPQISELSLHNPLIYEVIQQYARGMIITKEEALCRMVVELGQNWEEKQRQAFEAYRAMGSFTMSTEDAIKCGVTIS
jgi:hypothetical protein